MVCEEAVAGGARSFFARRSDLGALHLQISTEVSGQFLKCVAGKKERSGLNHVRKVVGGE